MKQVYDSLGNPVKIIGVDSESGAQVLLIKRTGFSYPPINLQPPRQVLLLKHITYKM